MRIKTRWADRVYQYAKENQMSASGWPPACDFSTRVNYLAYVHLGRSRISCLCCSQLLWRTMAGYLSGHQWYRLNRICPQRWKGSGTRHPLHSQSESSPLRSYKVMCQVRYTKWALGGDNLSLNVDIWVIHFGFSDYLLHCPTSSAHHRQSGHLPVYPHQGDKRGQEGHLVHQMGTGLHGLSRLNDTWDFALC